MSKVIAIDLKKPEVLISLLLVLVAGAFLGGLFR